MTNAALLTLAGLCLGVAFSGLLAVLLQRGGLREGLGPGLVYVAFIGMIALPVVKTFAERALTLYMPTLLECCKISATVCLPRAPFFS